MHPFRQPGSRGHAVARAIALLVLVVAALIGEPGHADPGDFQAMTGLWKIVTRVMEHGHLGAPRERWHCVDEGPDPWAEFAALPVPGHTQCERSSQHRSSTALSWTASCAGLAAPGARGRVDFDSPEHYTASVSVAGRQVVQVEGRRYAACTSPKD
ncbi:DUF3617 domain-containing protein [Dyella jiangningensis]|uniref:DUF3617 domain-containing protein n=1 Tax=Dyella jiangningensis TaxID=1379159 RepID=A0A328NVH6_9GAMM|nr:DUF3617 family protein [Dyella jiangningensis]RAO74447.1 hypothetical protein CA260_20440 [Dyella jiangningensis]